MHDESQNKKECLSRRFTGRHCHAILFTVISVAEAREACDLKGRLFKVFLFFLPRTTLITGVIAYAQQYTIKVR